MYRQNNVLLIGGLALYDMCVSFPSSDVSQIWCGERGYGQILSRSPPISAQFRVMATRYNFDVLRYWSQPGCYQNAGMLGEGYLCQGCGDYNPSGSLTCLKCGAPAVERWIRPFGFEFYVGDVAQNHLMTGTDSAFLDVELIFPEWDDATQLALSVARGNTTSFLANGYTLDSGLYLCKYCGQAVYEGETCPGCGGKRMPFQELVEIERRCVYCGKEVAGSIICPGCGARIKGLTFEKAFGNYVD